LDYSLCEGIPALQTSRSYPCPSGHDHFKDVQGLDVWDSVWHCVYKIYGLFW